MAKPLREGSLAEPPAPLPAHPACTGGGGRPPPPALPAHPACRGAGDGGGPLALPAPPPRRHPRLSCACPGVPPPPNFILYRCGTRGAPPAAAQGEFHPTEDGDHEGPPQTGGSRAGAVPNGHLPGEAPGPEQELGARLRRLGDAFQQTYEQQQREQRGGVFWGHLYRLVWQWLGGVYNLQAAALPAREAN